ncbi:Cupredoxin [Trichoderma austrokoningii]
MAWMLKSLSIMSLAACVVSLQAHVHDESFVPDAVLTITQENIGLGGIERYSTQVNGSVPGPTLYLPEDKVFWIRVYNNMKDENLTIHWHGLSQATYPFSDGTPLASQWPIPPLHFFDYELKAPNGSAGTYFYHSHVGFQASTPTGVIIVKDPQSPPYETDGERIVFLQEFWNRTDEQVVKGLESTPLIWTGEPNGWLINGKGITNYGIVDPSSAALSVIDVDPGKTYRFRFVAATALSLAQFAFQDHTELDIIAADGAYTKPQNVSVLQMGSGQRYDALFRTKSCDELRQLGKLDYYVQLESRDRTTVVTNYAILRSSPIKLPPTISGYLDYQLQPLQTDHDFPSSSEVSRRVMINIQQVANGYFLWSLNNNTWTEDGSDLVPHTTPSEPYLVALYENQTQYLPNYQAALTNNGLDPHTKTYPALLGEVIEIVFQQYGAADLSHGNTAGALDTHPWHAHGSHYWDVGGGDGAWDAEKLEKQLAGTTPVRRDTTLLYRYTETTVPGQKQGWRAWRLRVDQPGVWMVHCHLLHHMIQGMQTVWVHGSAQDVMKLGELDVEGYLTYGGNVNGNITYAPKVIHFHELD